MNPLFKRYLTELAAAMSRLSPEQRADALREIEAHFADASAAGAPANEVLARLGPPRLLAAALVAENIDQRHQQAPVKALRVLLGSVIITGASFTSLMVVPFLATSAVLFALAAIASPILGVLRMFGATWIHLDFAPGRSVPTELSIPVTVVVACVCAGIAFGSYKLLRLYLRVVARGYRAVLTRGALAITLL